ncbi:MAG: V-type ATP synthase subunit D [Oscillospiraceae bacterium]|jgi:H(+)-transporting ATP synthase, vacuolar type, subunit D|nr:V-type ATP synthase subunit D [Oscillospiraceae bacterium]
MAVMSDVKPTRMELKKTKARLKTAVRGHKLLKDKRDELMRQFLLTVRENKALRQKVEAGLAEAMENMARASRLMSPEILEQSLLCPKQSVEVDIELKNIMSVNIPEYSFRTRTDAAEDIYSYGYAMTSGELDETLDKLALVFRDMLELARAEKSMQLMAAEIERTRRRVNALEYVMIPQMEETIRYISMKLEENERSTITRLMKVKDQILQDAHNFDY